MTYKLSGCQRRVASAQVDQDRWTATPISAVCAVLGQQLPAEACAGDGADTEVSQSHDWLVRFTPAPGGGCPCIHHGQVTIDAACGGQGSEYGLCVVDGELEDVGPFSL